MKLNFKNTIIFWCYVVKILALRLLRNGTLKTLKICWCFEVQILAFWLYEILMLLMSTSNGAGYIESTRPQFYSTSIQESAQKTTFHILFFVNFVSKSCKNVQKTQKKEISTSVRSVQHLNTGQNIYFRTLTSRYVYTESHIFISN